MLVGPVLCRAQLFYNGHKHTMFRTCAVRFGQCATTRNPDGSIQGTVYLTGGNAGETVPFALQPMPDVVLSKSGTSISIGELHAYTRASPHLFADEQHTGRPCWLAEHLFSVSS